MIELKVYHFNEWHNEYTEFYLKSEADKVIAELKAENERMRGFCDNLVKDCKWLPTTITPDTNGFETMVQCTNGKKRVASFRGFDLRWYDVNNGNKLNVVKWLWQPRMPSDEKKHNDELRHHKYKRCLDKAELCRLEQERIELIENQDITDDDFNKLVKGFYKKWHKRWLELAEKFKEAK